jgi:hypothetical protein
VVRGVISTKEKSQMPVKEKTMEDALLEAAGIKPQGAKEDRQKFLVRIMVATQKLPSDDWEALDEKAQNWCNAAVEADNAEEEVPDFPDVVDGKAVDEEEEEPEEDEEEEEAEEDEEDEEEEEEEEPEKEPEAEEEEVKPTKKAAKKKAAAKKAPAKKAAAKKEAEVEKPAAKKTATKKADAPASGKGISMRRALKRMVVKKPSRSVDELIEALEKAGYKSPSRLTVTTIRADTRDTIKVLNEAGITDIAVADGRAAA